MNLTRIIYFFGALLLVLLLQSRHTMLALLLVLAGMVWGFLRIRAILLEAREREARQWQVDETLILPRTKNTKVSK